MIIVFFIWNIVLFLMYGLDKFFAVKGLRRIRERTLLIPAFALGSIGAMFGMVIFNHKTAKPKFRISVPLSVVFNMVLVYYLKVKL